ncbi:MAG: hypothetical protein JNM27_23145 [Leptospirales bacterium]|nr:hypothetical protein [Leptospirales bacterium]
MDQYPWNILEIPADSDRVAVRKAYARKLKTLDQKDSSAFTELRSAYEFALLICDSGTESVTWVHTEDPAVALRLLENQQSEEGTFENLREQSHPESEEFQELLSPAHSESPNQILMRQVREEYERTGVMSAVNLFREHFKIARANEDLVFRQDLEDATLEMLDLVTQDMLVQEDGGWGLYPLAENIMEICAPVFGWKELSSGTNNHQLRLNEIYAKMRHMKRTRAEVLPSAKSGSKESSGISPWLYVPLVFIGMKVFAALGKSCALTHL